MPWPQYFMNIVTMVAERSTCARRKVGAIAVRDKRILATGYNGAPRGMRDCLEIGCLRERLAVPSGQRHELCRGLHAEQNVIVQAGVHGVSLENAVIYCTHQPCLICTKMLLNCGVSAVLYATAYPDPMAEEMFAEAGVRLERLCPDGEEKGPDAPDHVHPTSRAGRAGKTAGSSEGTPGVPQAGT